MFLFKKIRALDAFEKAAATGSLGLLIEETRASGALADGSLRGAHLENAALDRLDLTGANLGRATLCGASLRQTSLRGATLEAADFCGANLQGADLRAAILTHALLEAANLHGAQVSHGELCRADSLVGATLHDGSRYDGRYALGGDLSLARADGVYPDKPEHMAEWYGVTLDAYEEGQAWAAENLRDVRVAARYAVYGPPDTWAQQRRDDGSLVDGTLRGEDLGNQNLNHSDLSDAVLPEAVLREVEANDADFRRANLSGATLELASLRGTNFSGAILREADLTDADLGHASLEGADMEGATLLGALLQQANLTGATVAEDQLLAADALTGATLPDGSRYDGRYLLEGDLEDAEHNGANLRDPLEMAHWYTVSVDEYEAGQKWAREKFDWLR